MRDVLDVDLPNVRQAEPDRSFYGNRCIGCREWRADRADRLRRIRDVAGEQLSFRDRRRRYRGDRGTLAGPVWLDEVVSTIAQRNHWSDDWINEAVSVYLSPLASRAADHLEFGSYPRERSLGLSVLVPTAEYLLALKLKAIRILDPIKAGKKRTISET